MKVLVIAEKPSVAKDISKVLKCNKIGDGYFYNDKYIVSFAIGHLVALCEPQEYDEKLKKWTMQSLPIIPDKIKKKPIKNTEKQLKILKNLMRLDEVESLVCATDSGREGELIFRYIYELLKCKKPFKRLWISSMTNEAIMSGFDNLKDGKEYDKLYFSAKCRSEADWLVGINASRVFTLKFGTLLSIGRVQTPTLAIIVNRHKEIEAFDSKEYFEIQAVFRTITEDEQEYKGLWIDKKNGETKMFDKENAKKICASVQNAQGIVGSVENEVKKQAPPLLYDLTELQRECNKKFSYSAQKTLSIAQNLYEKRKYITYPRTDSRYLSKDIQSKLPQVLDKLNQIDEYIPFLEPVLNNKLKITKRIIDDSKITDHHAIIPTITNFNLSILSVEEKNVYDLIARRFIAVFYGFYVYNITKIITIVNENNFLTKGTTILDRGFTVLNINTEKGKKQQQDILPIVTKNEEIILKEAKILNKKTIPPSHYNEATLLSAMENAGRFIDDENLKEMLKDSGLGTPATRASIIERLLSIGYVKRKGKAIIPTDKGITLISIAPNELTSPKTTGKWERGLSLISKGDMDAEKFMFSINKYVKFLIEYTKNNTSKVLFKDDYDNKNMQKYKNIEKFGKCLKCDGDILQNSKSFYCSNWKAGCNVSFWKDTLQKYGIMIDGNMMKILLKDKIVQNINIIDPENKENKTVSISIDNEKLCIKI